MTNAVGSLQRDIVIVGQATNNNKGLKCMAAFAAKSSMPLCAHFLGGA